MKSFFIAGTDTEVGKTFIAQALMEGVKARGKTCLGFKPVSAGCDVTEKGLRNQDALLLQHRASFDIPYEVVNPIAFENPAAPHLAARQENSPIKLNVMENSWQALQAFNPDVCLVEGAGGWRLPLDEQHFLSDFPIQKNIPVILVVGMKLGCLNHARLTAEIIQSDGLTIAGWVANQIDPDMALVDENIHSLKQLIPAEFLGHVPFSESPDSAVKHIKFNTLI